MLGYFPGNAEAPLNSGEEIGSRLKEFLEKGLGCSTIKAAALKLKVPRSSLDRWTKGDWISKEGLSALSLNRCNLHWLLTGWGEMLAPIHPDYFSNLELKFDTLKDDLKRANQMILNQQRTFNTFKIKSPVTNDDILNTFASQYDFDDISESIESNILDLTYGYPVRGVAAADDSDGSRVPDSDDFDGTVVFPPGLTFIPIQGESMSPVVLNQQYVMIDQFREGFETDGGIYVISIQEPDADDDERKEPFPGTYCKRVYDGGDLYYFSSINEYSPFSAWKDHCRMWPVIGVWFAGKGRVPKDFG